MTLQEQCEIYDILLKYYKQGERVTHAMLISHLRENNVRAGDYGFSSGLEFTQSLACFLEHEKVVPRPDAPPIWYVTLGERPLAKEQKDVANEPVEEEGKTTLPLATEEQLTAANLPATMTDENVIRFPIAAQRGLKGFLLGDRNNTEALDEEELHAVQRDYANAVAAGKVYFDQENANSFVIQLAARARDGSFLKINIAQSAEGYNYPFYVKYAGRDTSRTIGRKGVHMDWQHLKINFLGDSITEGYGVADPAKKFVALVETMTGATCRNYGIGGTRIAKQSTPSENPRHDMDFCSRVEAMDSDADILVVFGGTNDYGHGDAPLGTFEDRTPDTFYGGLHTLYTSLIEKYPASTIVVMTPLHRSGECIPTAPGKAPLKTYVEAIREVAEYYSLPLLDFFKTSGLQPAVEVVKSTYMPDGLHPNDKGHEILARKIIAFLQAL